eukprot:543354-Pelagomonas_calceolata.AAC.1
MCLHSTRGRYQGTPHGGASQVSQVQDNKCLWGSGGFLEKKALSKVVRKSPWGAGMDKMDIGSGDRLAQHNLHIPAHASNRTKPPYLFP